MFRPQKLTSCICPKNCHTQKKKAVSIEETAFLVIPLGFEPRTRTLKVYCSTS